MSSARASNTSFHLRTLAGAGPVVTRRDKNRIYYRLASDRVIELRSALRDVAAAHYAELDALTAAYLRTARRCRDRRLLPGPALPARRRGRPPVPPQRAHRPPPRRQADKTIAF